MMKKEQAPIGRCKKCGPATIGDRAQRGNDRCEQGACERYGMVIEKIMCQGVPVEGVCEHFPQRWVRDHAQHLMAEAHSRRIEFWQRAHLSQPIRHTWKPKRDVSELTPPKQS